MAIIGPFNQSGSLRPAPAQRRTSPEQAVALDIPAPSEELRKTSAPSPSVIQLDPSPEFINLRHPSSNGSHHSPQDNSRPTQTNPADRSTVRHSNLSPGHSVSSSSSQPRRSRLSLRRNPQPVAGPFRAIGSRVSSALTIRSKFSNKLV